MTTRPNILLVVMDQWRGDCQEQAWMHTPHLDGLAHEAVTFARAYSACPSCIAARASLMTGLRPERHGFVGYKDGVVWRYPVTLAGSLSAAGYHTQCVGKMHVHPARNLVGFHNVVLHDGYLHAERRQERNLGMVDDYLPWLKERLGRQTGDYVDSGLGCNGYAARPWPYDEHLHPMHWVTDQGLEFLRRRDPTRPFFLKVSYHRPHPPLDPPRDFLAMYDRREPPPLPCGDWVQHDFPRRHYFDSPAPCDPAGIADARRAYAAAVTYLDYQLNRLIHGLYEHGVWGNTAILFVSDHGDMLYDHHFIAKALPFEGAARIPFLLRLPRGHALATVADGARRREPVELRDVMPTLLDLAEAPLPPGLDGRSVLDLLRNRDGWRETLHGEHVNGDWSNQWITDGRHKYCWFTQTGRELLFDLEQDPREEHDLAGSEAALLARLRQSLMRELANRPEGFVQDGRLVHGRPQSPVLPWVGEGRGP